MSLDLDPIKKCWALILALLPAVAYSAPSKLIADAHPLQWIEIAVYQNHKKVWSEICAHSSNRNLLFQPCTGSVPISVFMIRAEYEVKITSGTFK